MKFGRNDPCPCGSGKKYKNCCLPKKEELLEGMREFEEFYALLQSNELLSNLDRFYASLKAFNNALLEKANLPNYIGANFIDAIDLTITSNALSLIKGFFQKNHYSITNALNLRNIIECYTLLFMDRKGDISDTHRKLFVEQYKLIEYESYAKGDSDKYKSLLNLDDLSARYAEGKQKFLDVVGSESKLKKIINSRLPFLCDEKLNYNNLIKQYCPQILDAYIYLSRMIHPCSYDSFRDEKFYNSIFMLIIDINIERYKDLPLSPKDLPFYREQALVYGFGVPADDNYGLKLFEIQNAQCRILKTISKEFKRVYGEKSYVKNFLDEVTLVLRDINTDSQLGYTENVKLKFKVIAEMFACFFKIYNLNANDDINYFYDMLNWHDIIKEREQLKQEITDDEKDKIYNRFIKNYPLSKLSKDEFFKVYSKQLGFLVDNDGNTPSLGQLVSEYLNEQYKDAFMANNEMKIKDFYKLVYKESNNMSHGCGYLYFSNIGAWMDDINVIQFLDNAIMHLLMYVGIIFATYSEESENNKIISDLIKEAHKDMAGLISDKMEILLGIKRIPKNF